MFPIHLKTKFNESLIIREAVGADASALIAYVNAVAGETNFLSFGAGDFDKTLKEEERIIKEHHDAKNKIFLVAELSGTVAGLLSLSASNKPRMRHVGNFGVSVRKELWGKGVGTNLLEAMLEWARSSSVIRKINLTVQTNNETAIALYKKFGFEIEGTVRRDLCIDGKFYDAYAMGILID